jgi:hypothetical protein
MQSGGKPLVKLLLAAAPHRLRATGATQLVATSFAALDNSRIIRGSRLRQDYDLDGHWQRSLPKVDRQLKNRAA